MATRFYEGSNNNSGAWRERIRLEDRTAKLVNLQLAATRCGKPFFDPDRPNFSRFGSKQVVQSGGVTSHALPHLVSDNDRKKLLEEAMMEEDGYSVDNLPPVPAMLRPSSRSSSRNSMTSKGSRASRSSMASMHGSIDSRLERLETSLEAERNGRMQVQTQLNELRKMMETSLSPTASSAAHHHVPPVVMNNNNNHSSSNGFARPPSRQSAASIPPTPLSTASRPPLPRSPTPLGR